MTKPDQTRDKEHPEDTQAGISGGVHIGSQHDTSIHGDVVGRDKVVNVNGHRDTVVWVALTSVIGIVAVVIVVIIYGIFVLPQQQAPSSPPPAIAPTSTVRKELQRISFDYSDSPANHGWQILDAVPITFTSKTDGHRGTFLLIQSDGTYAMDTYIDQAALNGTHIEFMAMFDLGTTVYAHIRMIGKNGSSSSEGWLKIYPGTRSAEQVDSDEWQISRVAAVQGGGWSLLQVDLVDAVRQTFGNQGWQYAQIDRVRIRDDAALAYIAIRE